MARLIKCIQQKGFNCLDCCKSNLSYLSFILLITVILLPVTIKREQYTYLACGAKERKQSLDLWTLYSAVVFLNKRGISPKLNVLSPH